MPRALYSAIVWLLLPVALARLWRRGRREPGYRDRVAERFGRSDVRIPPRRPIWIHAVSVGEMRAIEPLVDALARRDVDSQFLLTCTTPAGRATAARLFVDLRAAGRVSIAWLPWDLGFACRRFLRQWRPLLGLLVETEVWPTLLAECERAAVPVALINARLSARSAARGRCFGRLMRDAARRLAVVVAQTEADASRLASFGGPVPVVSGNLKFESAPPPVLLELGARWREAAGRDRPVVLLASTRAQGGAAEDLLLLEALREAVHRHPVLAGALVVVVPRHPQRFGEVARHAAGLGFEVARRRDGDPQPSTQVWIGDSIGEMAAYCAMADLVMIGGSWLPLGGQNLIEACACGRPVLMGPSRFNFAKAAADAEAAGALEVAATPALAWDVATRWLAQPGELARRSQAALGFAAAHRGATGRTLCALAPLLDPLPAAPPAQRASSASS